jgi:tetratricopeptide (TPR) repeat protein
VPQAVSRPRLLAYVATYDDLYWVLDAAQQDTLLTLSPALFDDDRVNWALARAQIYYGRGDRARARLWADSARIVLTAQLRTTPEEPQLRALLGLALSHQDRFDEAIREGARAVAAEAASRSGPAAQYNRHLLARTYILAGQHDRALDLLEALAKEPYLLTPGWLRIDPAFEALKGQPRFERLIEQ